MDAAMLPDDFLHGYGFDILKGVGLTIQLFLIVVLITTPVAFVIASIRYTRMKYIHPIVTLYVWIFRAVPGLLVLYFTFYGLPNLGISLEPFSAAVLGMCITTAAYMSEDFRAGLVSVGQGQWHAARSLGFTDTYTLRRIVLPQAAPVFIPPYMTQLIITVKTTAVASLVGVSELTGTTMSAISLTYSALDFLITAAIVYLIMTGVIAAGQALLEAAIRKRYRK